MENLELLERAEEGQVVTVSAAEYEILSRVPAVAAPAAHPERSKRYKHVNTTSIVDALRGEGFYVDRAHFTKTRKNPRANQDELRDPLYAKHQVVMRSNNLPEVDGVQPEFLVTNSHDGTSSLQLMEGAYRFICGNGLIIGNTFAKESIRHSGRAAQEAIDRAIMLSRNTEKWLRQMEAWKGIEMSPGQRSEFARLASVLRWGDANRFKLDEVLKVRRAEDDRGDLWTVYNRVQENAIKGGLEGLSSTGRRATSKPLSEISKSSAFNADLWTLATEFAE